MEARELQLETINLSSIDEVAEYLGSAGLHSSNLILGVDFTNSNEWPRKNSFMRQSLHHIGNGSNPYEQAISIIGKTLAPFDEENLIPCFGFGDSSTCDEDVFSFYPDGSFCHGFDDVLSQYREIIPNIRLAGPRSFAPIIEMATTIVKWRGSQYHVLVIILNGQVTRAIETQHGKLSPQEQKTIDAVVEASKFPLSIILVGVGDGPWNKMNEFHDNIPNRAFNNFQFVNFTEIMSKNTSSLRKEAAFALAALIDIPSQYKAARELGLLRWTNVAHIEAIDGSFIGKKESGLVWQRQEGDFGSYHYHYQAKELLDHLESVLANEPIVVKKGQHFVEVKPQSDFGVMPKNVVWKFQGVRPRSLFCDHKAYVALKKSSLHWVFGNKDNREFSLPLYRKEQEEIVLTSMAFMCYTRDSVFNIHPKYHWALLLLCGSFLGYQAKTTTAPFDLGFKSSTNAPPRSLLLTFGEAFEAFFPEMTHITKFMLCYFLTLILVCPLEPGVQIFCMLLLISAPLFYFPELVRKASGISVALGSFKLPLIWFATFGAVVFSLICGLVTLLMVYISWRLLYKGKPRVREVEVSFDGLSELFEG